MSIHLVRTTLAALAARQVDTRALAAELGLTADALDNLDGDARIDTAVYYRLWRDGAARTGDPDFGLHLGEHIPVGTYDLVDCILRSAATVADAIEMAMRYFRTLSDAAEVELVIDRDRAEIRHHPVADPHGVPRHLSECFLATLVARWRAIVGTDWPLLAVRFAHPAPTDRSAHARIFRTRIAFGCRDNALVFDAALLATPLCTADATLNAVLCRHGDLLLRELPAPAAPVAQRVRHHADAAVRAGDCSVDAVARRMATSRRSLQRRLTEEGTSAERVIDDVRRDLALRYLERDDLTAAAIAERLGFRDASAFYRAFRRWTQTTPAAYRATRS